jgi:uncharacterized protein YecT (DUF1311 family)
MNSRRGITVAATVAFSGLIGAIGARAADDGPASFDCAKDRSPLAVTICNDQPAAAAERRTAVSYLALYFKLDERSRVGFRVDHLQWIQAMSARCPQSANPRQFGADQLALSVQCVRQMYSQRTDLYHKQLSGAALEEVNLSPALLKKIQQRLVELKVLSGTVDGMFGADTRAAIRGYQASIGHAQRNFLSAQERTMLLEATTTSASTSSPKEAPVSVSEPLPQAAPPLRSSIHDPHGTDKQQPESSATDRAVPQTDQQNAPDAANPSRQAEAHGFVGAEGDLQRQYFIEGTLLVVILLAFTAMFGFPKLHRPRKRRVPVDAPAVEPMKEEPLHADPFVQVDRAIEFLKEACKS